MDPTPHRPSIIVIGAGLAGLGTALHLQAAGVDVTVLEREATPGGRVQTEQVGEYVIDTGPDALTGTYKAYLRLVEQAGLTNQLCDPSQVVGVVRKGRVIDIDAAKWWTLPFVPVLSFRAKFRVAWAVLRLRRMLAGVDPYDQIASSELDDPDQSAHDFALPRFGREATEGLIDPVLRLTTGSGAHGASALSLLAALNSWSSPLLNIRGGLGVVPAALAERVPVRYGCEVTALRPEGDGVHVSYRSATGMESLTADGAVVTALYPDARTFWPELAEISPPFADGYKPVQLISVTLGYSTLAKSRAYPVLVPTREFPEALLVFLQHNKAPDRAPAGHSLITVYTDTAATPKYLDAPDSELETWAATLIESLFPELTGLRTVASVRRWPKAGYHAVPGFWRRTRALRDALGTDSRIRLAGDLFGAGSMESAAASGERATEELLAGPLRR